MANAGRLVALALCGVGVGVACDKDVTSNLTFACRSKDDCASGWTCETSAGGQRVCKAPPEPEVVQHDSTSEVLDASADSGPCSCPNNNCASGPVASVCVASADGASCACEVRCVPQTTCTSGCCHELSYGVGACLDADRCTTAELCLCSNWGNAITQGTRWIENGGCPYDNATEVTVHNGKPFALRVRIAGGAAAYTEDVRTLELGVGADASVVLCPQKVGSVFMRIDAFRKEEVDAGCPCFDQNPL